MRLTIAEAAAHCGYKSRTMIYRLLSDGLLQDYVVGKNGRSTILESAPRGRASLREHVAACLQLRWDSPLNQRRAPTDASGADWPALAASVNEFLGADWPAPPWSGDQLNTVAMCLALAHDQAANGV